jgi:membrane fusion protein, heavy metal efflux system
MTTKTSGTTMRIGLGACALIAAVLFAVPAVRGVDNHANESTHEHEETTGTATQATHGPGEAPASTADSHAGEAHSETEAKAPAGRAADDGHNHASEAKPAAAADTHAGEAHSETEAKAPAGKVADDGHNHVAEAKPAAAADSHAGEAHSETEAKAPAGKAADDGHNHAAEAKPAATPDPHAGHAHAATEAPAPVPAGHSAADGHNHAAEAHSDEVKLPADAAKDSGLKIEEARRRELTDELTVPGRVSYNLERMAHIGTNVQGRVAELHAKLGDQFKKGDSLLVIDSPALGEAQSDCLQKRTQTQVTQSAVEVAQTAFDRAKLLVESKAMAVSELQKREGELKAAQGALQTARAALTSAENNLRLLGMDQVALDALEKTQQINPKYTVRAPIDGMVIEREVTLGEVVGPDRDALMVLADVGTLWVLADVPESRIHEVEIGTTATVTIRTSREVVLPGRLTYVAPSMQKSTRTAQVRVEVEDGHVALKPGMFAEVRLKCRHDADTSGSAMLAIPENAILTVEGKPSVFAEVKGEPFTYVRQPVEPGLAIGGMVQIASGLEEGARVVTDGAFILKAELAKGEMEGKSCSGH